LTITEDDGKLKIALLGCSDKFDLFSLVEKGEKIRPKKANLVIFTISIKINLSGHHVSLAR